MSLPSISCVSQPKARHLSATGSMSRTTAPSAWMPLQSISATRLSRRKCAAAIAASQVEPSCISPSESSTKTRAVDAVEPQPERLPTPWPRPWPSEPPIISTPGVVSSVRISSRLSSAP